MWGEPRKGTDAYKVKQMAEARKKEAKEKGLDTLVTDVYFEILERLKHKIENGHESWKKYKHPDIEELDEVEIEDNNYVNKLTFSLHGNNYAFFRSGSRTSELDNGYYCYLDLFIDNKKVFGLMVNEYHDAYSDTFTPALVTAYANDSWVDDLKEIQKHYTKVSKEDEIAFAEDPQKTQQMKDDFGISDNEIKEGMSVENLQPTITTTETVSPTHEKKPIWKRWWFWVLVIYLILISLS